MTFFFFFNWAQLMTEYSPNVFTEYTYLQSTKNLKCWETGPIYPTLGGHPSASSGKLFK